LIQALIPPSAGRELDNDRLEFLGDEALRLLASRFLYEQYPHSGVGELTTIRAQLVSNQYLSHWAKALGLVPCLPVGVTESQCADALEAVIGALYLATITEGDLNSGDFHLITPWLVPLLQDLAEQVLTDPARHNYKAALQEWTQHYLKQLPSYELLTQSPQTPTGMEYTYAVNVAGQRRGTGTGSSKRQAQQRAAQHAYAALPPTLSSLHQALDPEQQKLLAAYVENALVAEPQH